MTNAKLEQLSLTGPLCKLFSSLRKRISGDPEILELKHFVLQVMCWKTRGQATGDVSGGQSKPLLAKAGIKPTYEFNKDREIDWSDIANDDWGNIPDEPLVIPRDEVSNHWIVDLFVTREPDQQHSS